MSRILVVDDSATVRALFARVLSPPYDVHTTGSGEEALQVLTDQPVELALVDINLPGIDGFELLSRIRTQHPATRTALITDYDVDTYIKLALEKDVGNIIAKSYPFSAEELRRTVDNLLHGDRLFGLRNYLDPRAAVRAARVRSTDEVHALREACHAHLKEHSGGADLIGLCVALEETLSNAIYHAHGYRKLTQVTLRDDQFVEVAYGTDSTRAGIAVTDHSGRLTKSTVLQKIIRASGDEGLYDESGRGFMMSRAMNDRLIINIQAGKRTEIIALKYFGVDAVNRPLYINEV